MTVQAQVLQALAALGRTADEVAQALRKRGIKGRTRVCRGCPISEYLRTLGFRGVSAGLATILIDDPDATWYQGRLVAIRTPPAVRAFMEDFDLYAYPDLVLQEAA